MKIFKYLLFGPLIVFSTISQAHAQEFRIFTRIYDERAVAADKIGDGVTKAPVVVRSLSLFHHGKVYDNVPDIDEITIFEPAHNRFTIMSKPRMMATTVTFDELRQLLKVARHHTEEIIGELENEGTKQSKREAESLQFLLDPGFEERFDEKQKRLVLSSPFYQYTVLGADTETPKVIETYLNYTDWMARLNYVLHPSMMPGPRLMLNNSLRNKKLIPIEVDLKADLEDRFHLRAVHKIQWELTKQDRSLIHHWESLLNNKGMKHVSIRDYQKALVKHRPRQAKRSGKTRTK